MFSISGSMLQIYFTQRRRKTSFVFKDSDMESENLSSMIGLSVSDSQKTDNSKDVPFIGYNKVA